MAGPIHTDHPDKITVRLLYTKSKNAIANINVAEYDPERHQKLSRRELVELLQPGAREDDDEAAAATPSDVSRATATPHHRSSGEPSARSRSST